MRIAHEHTIAWEAAAPVRGGLIEFKTLLEGKEGRPDNFQLLLANTDATFTSPRHRHNFDQLRFALSLSTNIGPRCNLEAGDLAYFPEGTPYGPQNQAEAGEKALSMVVQFGGPSGNGYMSKRQLFEALEKLRSHGAFERGVFKRHSLAEDGRKAQDSYEAIWEFQNGRPISYCKPRYLEPVHMREKHFEWRPSNGSPGVALKHLGSFTEKGVAIRFMRIEAGAAYRLPAAPAQGRLVFIREGTGKFAGGGDWFHYTAMHLAPGESVEMRADTATEALVLLLPQL